MPAQLPLMAGFSFGEFLMSWMRKMRIRIVMAVARAFGVPIDVRTSFFGPKKVAGIGRALG